jgi:aldose 1-epimerase
MAPTPFTAATSTVGGMQAVSVTNGSVSATIALMGATLLRWSACFAGQQIDLVDGYVDQIEFDSQDGVRNGIMLPFVNRIADGRYTFADRTHDLLPDSDDRLIYHGALRRLPLTLSDVQTTESSAQIHFATSIAADTIPGYPFSLEVAIRYVITAREIALSIQGTNTGPGIALKPEATRAFLCTVDLIGDAP